MMHPVLAEAIAALATMAPSRPDPSEIVSALLETEASVRKAKIRFTYQQLIGTWQLQFITGTKRSRQKVGVALGNGRFIPSWLINIRLQYSQLSNVDSSRNQNPLTTPATTPVIDPAIATEWGRVTNSVTVGPLTLTLTGPTRLWPNTNTLAFDFTQMTIQIAGKIIYQKDIRGGVVQEQTFVQQSLKDQAFFTYFLVDDRALAARGRGGGLALWTHSHVQLH